MWKRAATLAIILSSSAACVGKGIDPPSPVDAGGAGTYALVSANGQPLPASAGSTIENCPRTIDSGSLQLDATGNYELILALRAVCPTPGGSNTVSMQPVETGKWHVSGTSLALTPNPPSVFNESGPTLSDTTVTMTMQYEWAGQLPAMTLVLRKQ